MEAKMTARRLTLAGMVFLTAIHPAFSEVLTPNARQPAADLSLVDANGNRVTLAALKGKVVLLDFWATWCTGCKEEMPWFMEFQKTYARRGLQSVGIAVDVEGWAKVRPYLNQHPVNYPVVT